MADEPSAKAQATNSLPVPDQITVEEDDNNAILTWNGDEARPDLPNPPGVGGYKVTWNVVGQKVTSTQYTPYRILQIQPLTNGVKYEARIQAVDMTGNLSAPSDPVFFTGNPERVNRLREQMTGFFDDFNRQAGPIDELKWNQAYSRCNSERFNASFINPQFHTHNMISDLRCDRGQVINRPRAAFDFTNRTGTIVFDMDGLTRRDIWYLDLTPEFMDITPNVDAFNEKGEGVPSSMLRISQNEGEVAIYLLDGSGKEKKLAPEDNSNYKALEWIGLPVIANVRRHWEIKVSQSQVQIFINGKLVVGANNINLPFTRATLLWNEFSYNTPKANEPYALLHWDNFGFDGPASNLETHNYRTSGYGGSDFISASDFNPVAKEINIPDSVEGATAQRLMFTLQQTDYSDYKWSAEDKVIINGQAFNIPQPLKKDGSEATIDYARPFSMTIPLPAGVLRTGPNDIKFVTQKSDILNIHVELDFPKGKAPAYTQPDQIYQTAAMPDMPEVGMGATVEKIGSKKAELAGKADEDKAKQVYQLSGIAPITFRVQGEVAMRATGKNPGAAKVQLRLNKEVMFEQKLNGAPYSELTYNFDTTKYANGRYQLDVVAFTPTGVASIPDYDTAASKSGDYYPVQIEIKNANPGTLTAPPPVASDPVVAQPNGQSNNPDENSGATDDMSHMDMAGQAPTANSTPKPAAIQSFYTDLKKFVKTNLTLLFAGLVLLVSLYLVTGAFAGDSLRRKYGLTSLKLRLVLAWPYYALFKNAPAGAKHKE
ncbi:MAG TPA: fibronectin type III domain-containing protein [Chloroflexia bacterium]|nr:fibronectin type III domain-containing protein [Chloroflexia bacterium]